MSCVQEEGPLFFFLESPGTQRLFTSVPLAGLVQDVLRANQNFSCFNLSPFPCVCYSLALTWADLGVGRQPGAHRAHCQGSPRGGGTVSALPALTGSGAGRDAGRRGRQAVVQVWTGGQGF